MAEVYDDTPEQLSAELSEELSEEDDEHNNNESSPFLATSDSSGTHRPAHLPPKFLPLPRLLHLSSILFTILMTFWLLDSLKDVLLTSCSPDGILSQPVAKFMSVGSTGILTALYNKIYRLTSPRTLFLSLSFLFSVLFMASSSFLPCSTPSYFAGYTAFLLIESFGSILVATFWGYATSQLTLSQCKRHYGTIIAVAQVGAIVGGSLASTGASVPVLYGGGGFIGSLCVGLTFYTYDKKYMTDVVIDDRSKEEGNTSASNFASDSASFLQGVYLILSHNYLLLLLLLSSLYEVVMTVLDYELKLLSMQHFTFTDILDTDEKSSTSTNDTLDDQGVTTFLGHYAQVVNLLSLLFSLFLYPYLTKRLTIPRCLVLFPILLIIATLAAFIYPSLPLIFAIMSLLKSFSYSINDPLKEILWCLTTNEVKFTAKPYIDVLGARVAKAVGSGITKYAGGEVASVVTVAALPCLVAGIALMACAVKVGEQFQEIRTKGEVVGRREGVGRRRKESFERGKGIEIVSL